MKKEEQEEQIGGGEEGGEGKNKNNRGKNKNNSSSNNGSDGCGSNISDSCSDHKQQTGFAADDTTDKLATGSNEYYRRTGKSA